MDISSDKITFLFNQCVKEQLIIIITKLCEEEGLNFVEIAEKYDLLDDNRKEYKPKKKRELKIPDKIYRCDAISAEGEQCKRSKKDGTSFCRRHKNKQNYGTIYNKPINPINSINNNNDNDNDSVINLINNNSDSDIEIDQNGNIITLENGQEVIYIPTTGIAYSYTTEPVELGKLSSNLKYIL